jgi:alpha-D-ribose 1-methylphosphonate 5-triphosphate synthase subunit PhnL
MQTDRDRIRLEGVAKTFTMHLRGGARLPVVNNVSFTVRPGECVVLGGPSGSGKSSILKMIYGNYRTGAGRILVRHDPEAWTDIATASPREILDLRRTTLGYVSQFLRAIPRVTAIDLITAAAQSNGIDRDAARDRAAALLTRLNVPKRLWDLAPATFSGGEQQRINIACGFAVARPIMLLDEPTASLDHANRAVVIELIEECKFDRIAVLGIFHDDDVRERLADRIVDVTRFQPKVPANA